MRSILNRTNHLLKNMFEMVDWPLLCKDKIKEVLNEFGATNHSIWYYYSTKFKLCVLINTFSANIFML